MSSMVSWIQHHSVPHVDVAECHLQSSHECIHSVGSNSKVGEEANNFDKQHCKVSVYQQITQQGHCKFHLQKDKVTGMLSRNLFNVNNSSGTFHQTEILKMHKPCISFK